MILLSMAPANAPETMRKALAMGAHRGVLVTDPALEGSCAVATTRVLAAALKTIEFDLVLALTTTAEARTLQYELFLLSEVTGLPNYPVEAAFALITTLPLVVVYLVFERQIVGGLTSGSIK